jgi:hypothetical protein
MTKLALLLSVSIGLLAGCAASEPDTTANSQGATTKGAEPQPANPPEVPGNAPPSLPELPGATPVPELPGATPVPDLPGATPVPSPSVCSHNATESSCLNEAGCAWGDQGQGPECFFVGNVVPFGN